MTMTRHILALLALLSGLAAFGGQAQASLAEALACNASIAASAGEDGAASENASPRAAPEATGTIRAHEGPARRPAAPQPLRLPVLMGIERAHE